MADHRLQRAKASPPADAERGTSHARRSQLQVTEFHCAGVDDLDPHALGVTYWFVAPRSGGPFTVKIHFRGRRIGVKGKPGRGDAFEKVETIDALRAGLGRVAVTTRVSDVAAGEWHVTATAEAESEPTERRIRGPVVRLGSGSSSGHTAFAPVIRISAPGATLGVWPALVGLGVVCALVVQFLLGRRYGLPTGRVLALSLVASLAGLVGAKAYYLVEHRERRPPVLTAGMCIQGFVLAAIATLVLGASATGISVARLLDVTTPGLLFAMTIGRFGCFFAGCCVGRPTTSRWGLWSSDRHLGVRRVPTQLMEAALALFIGMATAVIVADKVASPAGIVFAGAMSAYTLGRQLLFPLRDLPRNTTLGRPITIFVTAAALTIAVATIVVS